MIARLKKNKKKGARQGIFFPILLVILFLLVVGFSVATNLKISQRRAKLVAQVEALKKEIEIAERKNKELKEEISQTEGEEYLERAARGQLGLKKPGEEVVVVVKEKGEEKKEEEEKNWWDWIKSIFSR